MSLSKRRLKHLARARLLRTFGKSEHRQGTHVGVGLGLRSGWQRVGEKSLHKDPRRVQPGGRHEPVAHDTEDQSGRLGGRERPPDRLAAHPFSDGKEKLPKAPTEARTQSSQSSGKTRGCTESGQEGNGAGTGRVLGGR